MACRDADRQDAFVRARSLDDSFEARRDEAVRQKVAHRDELEISDPEQAERPRVVPRSYRFPILTPRKFPLERPQQAAVPQERPAQAQEDEMERQDAALMAQLQVSLVLRAAQLQELRQVSRQQVREQAAEHWSPEIHWWPLVQQTEAPQQDA
jgi:hypothetical protein